MAEGWLNYFTSVDIKVYSAGTKPEHVNPSAIKVMEEVGIDISKNTVHSNVDMFMCVKKWNFEANSKVNRNVRQIENTIIERTKSRFFSMIEKRNRTCDFGRF